MAKEQTVYVSAGSMWLFCCEKCGSSRDTLHIVACPWWVQGQLVTDDQCAYPIRGGGVDHSPYQPSTNS